MLRKITYLIAVVAMVACGSSSSSEEKKSEAHDHSACEAHDHSKESSSDLLAKVATRDIPAEYGYSVKVGDKVPEFVTELATGGKISTNDLKGKVAMIQFTASWCSVCRKEMPHIESDIWQKHKDNKDFVLIGIDIDEPKDKVIGFGKDMKVTYPLTLDPGKEIFSMFTTPKAGVTRNIIVDKDGTIIYLTRLYNEDEFKEMCDVIDLLLKR